MWLPLHYGSKKASNGCAAAYSTSLIQSATLEFFQGNLSSFSARLWPSVLLNTIFLPYLPQPLALQLLANVRAQLFFCTVARSRAREKFESKSEDATGGASPRVQQHNNSSVKLMGVQLPEPTARKRKGRKVLSNT